MKRTSLSIQAGITFIEVILYVAIVAIMLSALLPFTALVIDNGAKSAVQQEVGSQARYLSERIKYEIRNASGITSVSATTINLTENGGTNPTIISFASNQVTIQQGGGAVIPLHSFDTKLTSFAFTNYTSADNLTKHIGFTFTMAYNSTQTRQEYQQTVTMESSAEVRSN